MSWLLGVKGIILLPLSCWTTCAFIVILINDRTCGSHRAMLWLIRMSNKFYGRLQLVRVVIVLILTCRICIIYFDVLSLRNWAGQELLLSLVVEHLVGKVSRVDWVRGQKSSAFIFAAWVLRLVVVLLTRKSLSRLEVILKDRLNILVWITVRAYTAFEGRH